MYYDGLIMGSVPKKIKERTRENMDVYYMGLYDSFKEAVKEFAKSGTELYIAWYYDDFRKFIPDAYELKYLDFSKYPLKYHNIFYDANTKEKYDKTIDRLFELGYIWAGINKNPSFEDCKKQIHGNAKLIIHAFYNDINGKNEIQFGTRAIYNTYPQFKGRVKIIEA